MVQHIAHNDRCVGSSPTCPNSINKTYSIVETIHTHTLHRYVSVGRTLRLVNILYICYRFIYFYIVLYSCFKVGEEDVFVIAVSDEDRTGTAEHLSAEALELRSITAERHRF